jgi:hypothetical protein
MDRKPESPVIEMPANATAERRAAHVLDPPGAALMARSSAIAVSLADIHRACAEIYKLPPEERTRTGRTRCLLHVFCGQRHKAFVVNARLEAMARLVRAGQIPYWVRPPSADGVRMIADPVFLAAATVPLLFTAKESYFDPVAFVAFVLEHASVYGHG